MLAIPNKISYKKSLCCLTTAIKLNKRQTYNVCVCLYIVDMFFALHFRLTHAYFSNFCFSIFSSIFHFLYLLTILLTRWKHTSTHPHPNITKHFSLSLFDGMLLASVYVVLSKNENITDFFVEANIDDGTHKGTFRSETQSNWHRKHKQHHSNYYNDHIQSKDNFLNRKIISNQFMGTSVVGTTRNESTKIAQANSRIRVDESGILIPNNNDEQASVVFNNNNNNSNYTPNSSSSIRKTKRFKTTNHVADHCAQEYWSENIIAGSRIIQFTKRWSYTKTDLKNKTVSFRFVSHFNLDFCFVSKNPYYV